jgi:hypothetical protein
VPVTPFQLTHDRLEAGDDDERLLARLRQGKAGSPIAPLQLLK